MPRSVCLDASFVLAILLGAEYSNEAARRWGRALGEGVTPVVPPLFFAEVTSVLRSHAYQERLSADESRELLSESLEWPLTAYEDNPQLQRRALELAALYNRPKAYDAQYLAVAELVGCELWTLDRRLVNAVAGELPWVRWIGEES